MLNNNFGDDTPVQCCVLPSVELSGPTTPRFQTRSHDPHPDFILGWSRCGILLLKIAQFTAN